MVSPGIARFLSVLVCFRDFYRVSLSFNRFYWVLLGFTGFRRFQ